MQLRHVVKAQQFSREDLENIFAVAREMEKLVCLRRVGTLRGYIMATIFYKPSTRTRFSLEAAMLRMGGHCISTEAADEFSSAAKGETLEDTIRVVGGYVDVVVLRHNESGAAERAVAVSRVPLINAGDGPGQHPTQALLDLYTIRKEVGRIDGITVTMVGDLAHGRTVRSLAYLLSRYEVTKLIFVAPDTVRMRDDIKAHLTEHGIAFEEEKDLMQAVREADVVYQTRIQQECFGDRIVEYHQAYGRYIVDKNVMEAMRRDAILMHPLPRNNEINPEVDSDPRAAYFRQSDNGIPIRMALLKLILAPEA